MTTPATILLATTAATLGLVLGMLAVRWGTG